MGISLEIEENTTGLGKKWVMSIYDELGLAETYPYDSLEEIDFNYLVEEMEKGDFLKNLTHRVYEIERKLGLAKLDSLLSEYEVLDLEIKLIDLKLKIIEQGHTNNLKQNFTKTLQN